MVLELFVTSTPLLGPLPAGIPRRMLASRSALANHGRARRTTIQPVGRQACSPVPHSDTRAAFAVRRACHPPRKSPARCRSTARHIAPSAPRTTATITKPLQSCSASLMSRRSSRSPPVHVAGRDGDAVHTWPVRGQHRRVRNLGRRGRNAVTTSP
jgi:hypothetical protein